MAGAKVETIARLAQWKIERFSPTAIFKSSDRFKMGIWNWHLSLTRNGFININIRIFLEPSSEEQPLLPRFIFRLTASNRRPLISPVHEGLLRSSAHFTFPIEIGFPERFIVDVEFLDLKINPLNGEDLMRSRATRSSLRCLSRMLDEAVHADVSINTADGSLRAHKAVLSASSPVFHSMFQHDLKEKKSCVIDIADMTTKSCMALLSYLYGTINQQQFWKHRLELLGAANKYDIPDLKYACEESLLEDINSENVLEILEEAWLYQLDKLKKRCLSYLVDFGKIYDVREVMNDFFRQADKDLVVEMFQEVLVACKLT